MSSYALNNIVAPDNYETPRPTGNQSGPQGSTLDNLGITDHINIDVYNGGVFFQLKQADVPGRANPHIIHENLATWQTEVFMASGSRTIDRPGVTGIRLRASVPAAQLPAGTNQARFTVEAVIQ